MTHLVLATSVVLLGALALDGQTTSSLAPPVTHTGPAAIHGRVTAAGTGLPIPNVRLTLDRSGDQATGRIESALSDADGQFQFANLPAGGYTVSAAKAGYVPARFGARTYFERPGRVVVEDRAVNGVDIELVKSAAISGRIVDDLGDPAVGASVSVSRRVRIDGVERFTYVKGTQTDDLGEYRLGGLPAGRFVVAVGGGGGTATRWTRTFFPGTVMLSRAQDVTVGEGDDLGARDFTAAPVGSAARVVTLSGAVVGADGGPITGSFFHETLDEIAGTGSSSRAAIAATGQFSFQAEPGEHLLIAQGATGGIAGVRVSVGDSDVTGLRLVVAKGGRVTGRVVFDGTAPPGTPDVELEAWSAEFDSKLMTTMPGSASPLKAVTVNRDGTFEIPNLFGARELRVRSAPPGWVVRSMTVEGRSVMDTPIDFSGGRELTGVQILMTDRSAQLLGAVTNVEGRAITVYSVIVFADDPSRIRRPSRIAQWVRPDQAGRFSVDGLTPGEYLIAAVDQVADDQWSNLEYLDRLRRRATRVVLAEGEKKTLSLERIEPDAP